MLISKIGEWVLLHCTGLQSKDMERLSRIVQILIEHGATVDHQNVYGSTPLHAAAKYGHTPILQLLIDHGTDWLASILQLSPAERV